MNEAPRRPDPGRRRPNKNIYTTKSGKTIKLNTSLGERLKAGKNARAAKKAAYLSTLPKNPLKRVLARVNPKHLAAYWFSREGGLMALKIAGVGIVVCFFIAVGVFAYFRKDLPKIKDISGDRLGGSITYYDSSGATVLWQDYDGVKRIPVEGTEMSQFIKDATVAVEDKDFYKHGAFDARGILRAAFTDVVEGHAAQGGSTITQQLVKLNQQWTNERTITRKVKELILAVELEREYSKADILTGYLNIAPYGGVEYGVESAARDYFGTTAKNLTLAQAAFLAAIPKSPGIYSPYNSSRFNPSVTDESIFDEEALIGRQHFILNKMVEQGYVTKAAAEEAKKVDLLATIQPLKPKYQGIQAPYFVLSAKQELEKKYGTETVKRGGWRITTTLDMNLQKLAEDKVAGAMPTVRRAGGDTAAFVAADVKTGQVVALVGGAEFGNEAAGGFLNFGSAQKVSPGSSFKPYDYAAMIHHTNNVGAGSVLYDTQGPLPGYPCTNKNNPKFDKNTSKPPNCLWNYDFAYPGPMTLRYALGGSRNVPAVKAMLTVGVDKTIKIASEMMGNAHAYKCYAPGTDVNNASAADESTCFGSAAIGDGAYLRLDDHVTGLATMSRNGALLPKTYIKKITDGSGKPIMEFKTPKAKQIIKPDAAYIVNDMASDPNASYLNAGQKQHRQKNGWKFAIKTGTTNDNFDGLMASWSAQYATVSWVGYHTRQKALTGTAMENMTGPITLGWMQTAHANLKAENWVAPQGMKTLPAFVVRNKVSRLSEVIPSPQTDLFPSWYTPKSGGTTQTTDKVSGRVATSCTPALARQTFGNSNVSTWNVDQWAGGSTSANTASSTSNSSNQGSDNIHNCSDAPPTVTLTAPPTCSADLGGCTITATVAQGTFPLNDDTRSQFPGTVNFSVGSNVIKSFTVTESPSTVSFQYTPTSSGELTMTATVIDSVLYSATDTSTLTAEGAAPNLTITSPTANQNVGGGGTVEISWTGGKPAYVITMTGESPKNSTDNSVTFSSVANGTHTVTVTDANGKTATVTFTKT